MPVSVTNWEKDARRQFDNLADQVRSSSDMGFSINRDFILKTALTLSDSDVRLKIKNFTGDQVAKIEQDWDDIKTCILEVFRLIRSFGLNDETLRAKNAAIPIAYYLFHKGRDKTNGRQGLYADINNRDRHKKERMRIRQWLHTSLLKGMFGSQWDALLDNLRKIIRSSLSSTVCFPLDEIITDYRGTTKNLVFDDDFINRLLKTQKEDTSCFSILALLFPNLDFTQSLDIDHLHPAASFRKERLDSHGSFGNPGGRTFYENPENWNGIANLHLLNSSKSKPKQDVPLDQWLTKQNEAKAEDLLIPTGTDLSFGAFESFINARATFLKQKLGSLVGKNDAVGAQGKEAAPDNPKSAKSDPTKPRRDMVTTNRFAKSSYPSLLTQWERAMEQSFRYESEFSRTLEMFGLTTQTNKLFSAYQHRQEMFKQNTAFNLISESLHAAHQSSLDMLKSLQQEHSWYSQHPTARERLMANFGIDEIGDRYKTITGLKSSMDHVAPTYESLAESLLRKIPDITRLPTSVLPRVAGEISTPSFGFETLRPHDERDEEDAETKIQLVATAEQETSGCIALLKQVDPRLVQPYNGARDALHGNNPDKARQCMSSLRELWNNLLRILAPDGLVLSWIPVIANRKNLLDKGKPTRRTRVLYICRGPDNAPPTELSMLVAQELVKLMKFLNQIHNLSLVLPYKELRANFQLSNLLLGYILQISVGNSHK